MDNSNSSKQEPKRKFCPPPSIASQIAKAQIIKESEALTGPHGLSETIVAKMDTKDIPQTPEEIRSWIKRRSHSSEEWKRKRFIPPDASNP